MNNVLKIRAMKVIKHHKEKNLSQHFVSRIEIQNFGKVQGVSNVCLKPFNLLVHIAMLAQSFHADLPF